MKDLFEQEEIYLFDDELTDEDLMPLDEIEELDEDELYVKQTCFTEEVIESDDDKELDLYEDDELDF